jgi:uroporphyrinogen-III decarboxylase
MMADEYDALIQDPSFFWTSTYLPRICGAMEPFKMLQSPMNVQEGSFGSFVMPFAMPEVQAACKTLFEAGTETMKWMGVVSGFSHEMATAGFPGFLGGLTKAPFDVIGDTLRGTRGVMVDMYRQPDKLLQALEVVTPFMIKMGVSMARMNGNPLVFMPLHKGADGFLSDEQFKTFYWPSLRKVFMGLIDEGCIPFPFVEGSYNSRLEIISDVPRGKTAWTFDLTDMAKAKQILGDIACISGNISSSMLITGTTEEIKATCRQLIDTCAPGGGYIMTNGAAIDDVKPENLKAMIDFTKEYGVYR